jgi:2-polyprenyl-3-methyl-5-hydroxy-6-metoxy-1,4-benzoquinol methylase
MNLHTQQPQYVLGHAPEELRRLILQAVTLRPFTARLLRDAKIGPGMRVLDLGCGAGDVTMLVAEMVGPSGSVVGIDRSAEAIALARERIGDTGRNNIAFAQCAVEDYPVVAPFDAVVGRYILIHQSDPVGLLRAATCLLRPGGIIAFHEPEFGRLRSIPTVEIWDETAHAIVEVFRRTLPHYDIAGRLIGLFADARLPCPKVSCEVPIGGGTASPLYAWLAETLRSLSPQISQLGMATGDLMPIDSLESRLRAATVAASSQVEGPGQICAWAKL